MTSPGVMRMRTAGILQERIAKFGNFHPATFAAYGRAFVAWDGRVRAPVGPHTPALARAYTTAQMRVYGDVGWNNRAMRKSRRKRRPYRVITDERGTINYHPGSISYTDGL